MAGPISFQPTSSWAGALRQGQAYPPVPQRHGAQAASLLGAGSSGLPARRASSWVGSMLPHSQLAYCPADALRVATLPRPPVGPRTWAFVDFTDARNCEAIIAFAKLNLWAVDRLGEGEKQHYFVRSTRATLAILLYEFASGTGAATARLFEDNHAIVHSMRQLAATDKALEYFYEKNRGLSAAQTTAQTYGYQFSPNLSLAGAIKSLIAHGRAIHAILSELDFLQLFLGGVVYQVRPDGGMLDITITDDKGRSTWYLHANSFWDRARNVPRDPKLPYPQPLTTISQRYHFRERLELHRLFTTQQWLNNAENEARKILTSPTFSW